MGFMSGILMTYVSAEDCFCMMNQLFTKEEFELKPMYLKGMPGLEKNFYTLLCL